MNAIVSALSKTLNAYLRLDPQSEEKLRPLSGKVVKVETKEIPFTLYLLFEDGKIHCLEHFTGEVDTTVRGTPFGLVAMGLSKGTLTNRHLFSGDVEIHGDSLVGQGVKQLFDSLQIDWEEHLSSITGDVVAHQIGTAVRDFMGWQREVRANGKRYLTDYLQEEANCLPPKNIVDDFSEQVDDLRLDLDRLDARIRSLEH